MNEWSWEIDLYTWNIEVCIEIVWITSKIKSREGILFYLC